MGLHATRPLVITANTATPIALTQHTMQIAKFYGASDDLIEVSDIKGADEFSAYGSGIHTVQRSALATR